MVWNINQHDSDHFCLICKYRGENFFSICNWTCNHLVSISSQYHLIIYKTTFSICHMSMIINFIKTHAIGTLFCFVLGHPCTFHICCVRAALAVTGETRNTWVRVVFSLRCKLSPVIRALIRNTAKSDTSNTCTVGKINHLPNVQCVSFQPKKGFIPLSALNNDSSTMKTGVCKFCMHQRLKVRNRRKVHQTNAHH